MKRRRSRQAIEDLWRNQPGPSMLLAMSDATEAGHGTHSEQPPEDQAARHFGWSDMFVHPHDDPREEGEDLPGERAILVRYLRDQRLTLEMKCSGLDAGAMARRSVEPSTMSLLGLVRHLAEMERRTFREMLAGQDVPRLFWSDTDRDGDFDGAVPDPQIVSEAWDAWHAEVDFATRFVDEAPSLDITGDDSLNQHGSGGGSMSLREVLVGTIGEYARHMGHADLLRERVDGRIGQ